MRKSTLAAAALAIPLSISTAGATQDNYLDIWLDMSNCVVDLKVGKEGCSKHLNRLGGKLGSDFGKWWYGI